MGIEVDAEQQAGRPIPDGWHVSSIDELCTRVTSGGTPLRSNREFFDGGSIHWFKTKELNEWYIEDSEEKITAYAVQNTSAKIFPPNTVLMAMYGDGKTITSLGILRNEAATNQACCALIANPKLCDYLFLFYALKYHRAGFLHLATGGAQRNLSGKIIRNFHISVPPLREQHAISKILGSFDEKIALNRRMNATLEALARALFKSWFVDFDPVRAKAEGRQPAGMDAATAALFPNRFEDSALGEIPQGWQAGSLGDVAATRREGIRPDEVDQSTPYIGLEHMPRGSIALGEWGVASEITSNKSGFSKGDILFGKLRPYFRKVGVAVVDGVCSTDILVVAPKTPEWFGFVLGHVSSAELIDSVNAASTGTKMPRASWNDIARYPAAIPPNTLALAYGNIVQPMIARIAANILEMRTLAALRDTLLPKLMSGEVRVRERVEPEGRTPSEQASAEAYYRHLRPNDHWRR